MGVFLGVDRHPKPTTRACAHARVRSGREKKEPKRNENIHRRCIVESRGRRATGPMRRLKWIRGIARARTPKNTHHLPRVRIGLDDDDDDGWTSHRTNDEFHWNRLPTPMRNQRFTRCTTRRDARARHPCPVVWVDPKNLIRCPCVCASSSSSSSPPTSIDPFDRSIQSDVFRFVSTRRGRRSGVVRTSCVHRATRKGGSVGSSALQKPSRARERIGRAIFVTVYPYVLVWVRVFGFW